MMLQLPLGTMPAHGEKGESLGDYAAFNPNKRGLRDEGRPGLSADYLELLRYLRGDYSKWSWTQWGLLPPHQARDR